MKHILTIKDEKTVAEAITRNILGISKVAITALLKKGEVRLNGTKCLSNQAVNIGDEVSIFVPQKYMTAIEVPVIYSDKNILIVDKPPLMDVENNLLSYLKKDYPTAAAVHRLDRNTRGLVVFALNQAAYDALIIAFKDRLIDKYYYALVNGKCDLNGNFEAYLVKDSDNAQVKIYADEVKDSKKIITYFDSAARYADTTLLNVKLITGRTHQIRAHLSFLGYPIIGDNKYGDFKRHGKKLDDNKSCAKMFEDRNAEYDRRGDYCQAGNEKNIKLAAYKVIFKRLPTPLEYLNSAVFKIDINFID